MIVSKYIYITLCVIYLSILLICDIIIGVTIPWCHSRIIFFLWRIGQMIVVENVATMAFKSCGCSKSQDSYNFILFVRHKSRSWFKCNRRIGKKVSWFFVFLFSWEEEEGSEIKLIKILIFSFDQSIGIKMTNEKKIS